MNTEKHPAHTAAIRKLYKQCYEGGSEINAYDNQLNADCYNLDAAFYRKLAEVTD